jgi:hypothetical protein
LEEAGLDGRIILKWIFEEVGWRMGLLMWFRIGTRGGLLRTIINLRIP